MSLKKLCFALLAVFALGAVMASSAFAENEFKETGGQWYTGASPGTKLPVGTTFDVTVSGGASSLSTTIASIPIALNSTGVTGKECSLVNQSTTKATIDCKSLTYEEVTVSGIGGCEIAKNAEGKRSIATKAVTAVLGMNTAGTKATFKINPQEGATFLSVELTGEKCSFAGIYKITGTNFAEAKSATGVFAKNQEFSTGEAIQKSAGTPTSMKFGENPAFLTGSLSATAATEWAGKEK